MVFFASYSTAVVRIGSQPWFWSAPLKKFHSNLGPPNIYFMFKNKKVITSFLTEYLLSKLFTHSMKHRLP